MKLFQKKIKSNINESDKPLNKKNKIKIPRSSQDTIPFQEIYSNGMIKVDENHFCIIIKFKNINYSLLRDDEKEVKFNLYKELINSLDTGFYYQEFLTNEAIDSKRYEKVLLPSKPIENEISKDYVKVQKFFIDESFNASSETSTYIALGYKIRSKKDDVERILKKGFKDISIGLKKIGSECTLLNNIHDVSEVFFKYFNPLKKEKFLLPPNIYSKGMKLKDYIAPSSFVFNKDNIEMGMAYTRILFVRDYPHVLTDKFVAELLDNPYNISISKHVNQIDKSLALKFLTKHLTSLEQQKQERNRKNAETKMNYINPELIKSIDETNLLIETLNNDQSLFSLSLYISISAESMEDLNEITSIINTVCLKHQVKIDVVTHRQEKAMCSMLPLANDKASISSKRPSDDVSILLPFSSQNIFDEEGFYYGRNSFSGQMVILDRKKLKNGNGFVLGVPGSGKSFKEKREIIDVIEQTEDDIIVIDPEREFGGIARRYSEDGEVIRISANTNTNINPFDINKDYADQDDPIQMKSEFIMSLVETVKGNLSPKESTLIDRCVRLVYKEFLEHNWDYDYIPTLEKFYDVMKQQKEREAEDIAVAIELYAVGSLSTFSKKTNVSLNKRITVFDTKDLGKQLKKLGLLVVLDYVWNLLCLNKSKGKNTWIITDEFYLYFDDTEDKNSYSADYYYMIYKRSRKYGGLVTGITQNVEDLLQSPKAKTMLANSQFLILLDQSPTDREIIKKLLRLSEGQENFITNADKGCGLLVCDGDIIPIEDKYPKDNLIYETITTNLQEIAQIQKKDELAKAQ